MVDTYTTAQLIERADAHEYNEMRMSANMLRYAAVEIDRLRGVLANLSRLCGHGFAVVAVVESADKRHYRLVSSFHSVEEAHEASCAIKVALNAGFAALPEGNGQEGGV